MDQNTRMKIPDAPKDLFQQIAGVIRTEKESFYVGCWHGERSAFGPHALSVYGRYKSCATTHCIAGWITFLTPGGLALESRLLRKWNALAWSSDREFTPYVRNAGRRETPTAALLILEKAGWSSHISEQHFYMNHDESKSLIRKLAKIERDRNRRRAA